MKLKTKLLRQVSEAIAPARCLGCLKEGPPAGKARQGGSWLCVSCRVAQEPLPLTCIVCRKTRARGATCRRCRSNTVLTGVVSAGSYRSPLIQRGVHWLKFKGVRAVVPTLAELVYERLLTIAPIFQLKREAVLVPIPLHRRRLRERGFNQSADIAGALSEITGIPVSEVLERGRATWTQTKLPSKLRAENMAGAFVIKDKLPDKKYYLLLDDVTTTGATLSAAAEALQVGQGEIWGVTIARG